MKTYRTLYYHGDPILSFRATDDEALNLDNALSAVMPSRNFDIQERLFVGKYPEGLVFADTGEERDGDFRRLAFISYCTLQLEFAPDCPAHFKPEVQAHAAELQAWRGERYEISATGQYVILGGAA